MAIIQCAVCNVGWAEVEPQKRGTADQAIPVCTACIGKPMPQRHAITERPNLPESNDPTK